MFSLIYLSLEIYSTFFTISVSMGRPEVDNPPPSPSPMDRSTASGDYYPNEGGRGLFGDPVASAKSRKKWIALGLCLCLILVLLIAVIVLATSKDTPPPCPLAKNNSDAVNCHKPATL